MACVPNVPSFDLKIVWFSIHYVIRVLSTRYVFSLHVSSISSFIRSKKNKKIIKTMGYGGPNSEIIRPSIRAKAFFGPWQYERRFLLVVASGRGIVAGRIGGTRKPVLRQASATLHLRSPHERCA